MPDTLVLTAILGLGSGIVLILLISTFGSSSFQSSNIGDCTGYLCKYQQKVIWDQLTQDADCRDKECALKNMLECKSVTVAAIFGDGNNATIIRVYRGSWQPNNGSIACWIDIIKPQLLNYTKRCPPCETNMNSRMINADIFTTEMASWHVRSYDQLVAKLTYQEPGKRFGGAFGQMPMSQFFSHKV